jgi:hypothetical protein
LNEALRAGIAPQAAVRLPLVIRQPWCNHSSYR